MIKIDAKPFVEVALAQIAEAGFTQLVNPQTGITLIGVRDPIAMEWGWYEVADRRLLQDNTTKELIDIAEQPGMYSPDHHTEIAGTFARWADPATGAHGEWVGPAPESTLEREVLTAIEMCIGSYEE